MYSMTALSYTDTGNVNVGAECVKNMCLGPYNIAEFHLTFKFPENTKLIEQETD